MIYEIFASQYGLEINDIYLTHAEDVKLAQHEETTDIVTVFAKIDELNLKFKQDLDAVKEKYEQKCAHVATYYDKEYRAEHIQIYYTYYQDGVSVSQEKNQEMKREMWELFNKYDKMEALETPTADTIEFSSLPDDFVRYLFLSSKGGKWYNKFDDLHSNEDLIHLEDFWNVYNTDARYDAEDYWDSKKGRHGAILKSYIENNNKRIEGLKENIEGLKESLKAAQKAFSQSKPYFPQSTKSSV